MSAARHARAGRRWQPWVVGALVAMVAAGLGVGAAAAGAHWSDERTEVLPPPVTSPAHELPVLVPAAGGATPSEVGGSYALEPYGTATRLLATWGVADATAQPTGEPVLTDGAVSHASVCSTCPGAEGIVLAGRRDPPANVVGVFPYPRPSQEAAAECGFADVADDELPVAVVTGNPGTVELRVGPDRYVVESTEDERDEWEAWMDGPAGDRPAGSLVAHCVAVPMPEGTEPVVIAAAATDGTETTATAVAAVGLAAGGSLGFVMTPLDGTLLAVDVPVSSESEQVSVGVAPADGGCASDAALGPPSGWRPGSTTTETMPPSTGERPYLSDAAAVIRHVVPLAEGTPTFVCVDGAGDAAGILVTPPDARRLTLLASVVDGPASTVEVEGTFATVGWAACRGRAAPGAEVVLCDTAGDTGAIAAAGGLLDVAVRTGESEEVARIALSTLPGGRDEEVYRLPVPGGGTVAVTARWEEGPEGATAHWHFALAE